MRNLFLQNAVHFGGPQRLDKVVRNADVLAQGLPHIERRARRPAQQERLYEGGIRHAGVACAEASQEPGRAGPLEDAGDQVADGVEMRPAEEEGALAGPRVGVDDEEGHVERGVEGPALLAWVEGDAGHGGVGPVGGGRLPEGLEGGRGAVRVACCDEGVEVEARGEGA